MNLPFIWGEWHVQMTCFFFHSGQALAESIEMTKKDVQLIVLQLWRLGLRLTRTGAAL